MICLAVNFFFNPFFPIIIFDTQRNEMAERIISSDSAFFLAKSTLMIIIIIIIIWSGMRDNFHDTLNVLTPWLQCLRYSFFFSLNFIFNYLRFIFNYKLFYYVLLRPLIPHTTLNFSLPLSVSLSLYLSQCSLLILSYNIA